MVKINERGSAEKYVRVKALGRAGLVWMMPDTEATIGVLPPEADTWDHA
jgi:hypothetical protein